MRIVKIIRRVEIPDHVAFHMADCPGGLEVHLGPERNYLCRPPQ